MEEFYVVKEGKDYKIARYFEQICSRTTLKKYASNIKNSIDALTKSIKDLEKNKVHVDKDVATQYEAMKKAFNDEHSKLVKTKEKLDKGDVSAMVEIVNIYLSEMEESFKQLS